MKLEWNAESFKSTMDQAEAPEKCFQTRTIAWVGPKRWWSWFEPDPEVWVTGHGLRMLQRLKWHLLRWTYSDMKISKPYSLLPWRKNVVSPNDCLFAEHIIASFMTVHLYKDEIQFAQKS